MMDGKRIAEFLIFESRLKPGVIAINADDMVIIYLSPAEARQLADILYAIAAEVESQKGDE